MSSYFKLIRWPNLIIVAATLYLVRWVVIPAFDIKPTLYIPISELGYALMVLSTVFTAAAGYVINDIRDLEIDKINRPRKHILQRKIRVKTARLFYYALNITAGLIISAVCIYNEIYFLILVHLISMFLLWLYSTDLKCKPFIGNITISFLSAFIPILGLIYFYVSLKDPQLSSLPPFMWYFFISYFLFSFLISWVREIYKDMEDRAGDKKNKCLTLALKWNRRKVMFLGISITTASLLVLIPLIIKLLNSSFFALGISLVLIAVLIPLDFIPRMVKARRISHYKQISMMSKLILASGILFLTLMLFS